jgi:4-amino-4-deoxy-L-arabinose transferase-like glycosyltransferase
MGRGAGIARVLASRWWLAGVLVAGAGLRVAHVLALRDSPWFEHLVVDPQYYDAWAQRIAAGDWLGDRAFYMDPLYPYVLGALYGLAGRDLLLARLVNVAFSTGACLFVARIGAVAGGRPVGGLAALGYALYQPEIFYTGEVDKTSLSMLLGAAALALFLSRAPAARFASGAAVAAAALTRANFLSFVPLGAVACLAYSRRPDERRLGGIREAALFLAGAALVLAPVAWRNHHVSGAWVVTTTQMGQNFYTGNNPTNPYGAYGAVPFVRPNPHFEEADFRAEAEARTKRTMSPAEVSAYWLRAALSHIGSAPGFALAAFGRKAVLFWNHFEISDNQDQYLLERFSWVMRLPLLGFGAVVPLALLGALGGLRSGAVRILVSFTAVYWASLVVFFLFSRYRLPVVVALVPLAALGAVELATRFRARRGLVAAVAIVGAGLAVCHLRIGIFQRDHPLAVEMRLRHLAATQREVGQLDAAIGTLKEAVAQCPPGCPWSLADLFETYLASGRAAEGAAWFERFVPAHPQQRDAPGYLGRLRAAAAGG